MNTYWKNIQQGVSSSWTGLMIALRHLWQARKRRKALYIDAANYFEQKNGMVTVQYPKEQLEVPEIARYKLHNEIDDCIVCDKCAKICPVNCIDIEPVKSVGEFGKTSDGTSKRIYAAKFDIDMAKCCFCGLCTTVCPTECLTMTDEYDFSVSNIAAHKFKFANLSEAEIQEKKELYEQFLREKEEAKKQEKIKKEEESKNKLSEENQEKEIVKPKVAFKPKIKPS